MVVPKRERGIITKKEAAVVFVVKRYVLRVCGFFCTAFALTLSSKERQRETGEVGKMVELRGMGKSPCTKLALSVEPWTIS